MPASSQSQTPINPATVMRMLSELLPEDTRLLVDSGNSYSWSTHYYLPKQINRYRVAMGLASMGWAIGAIIGTQAAVPDSPVMCISGDGSFLMSGQEITVAIQHGWPTVFMVLNDSALGMVKHGQRMSGAQPVGFTLPPVDFAKMGEAMGAFGMKVNTVEELGSLDFSEIFSRNRPTLIDVRIDPEAVPPIGLRVSVLQQNA